MAKALLGPLVQQLRGKQGNVVFCYGHTGAYTRALITPPNPQTAQQQNWRSYIGNAWTQWGATLTDAQRLAWNKAAANFKPRNKTANAIQVTGQQMYVKQFAQLSAGYELPLTDPAPSQTPPDPGTLTAYADSGANLVTLTPANPLPPDCTAIIYATGLLPPGWSSFNDKLRQLTPISLLDTAWDYGTGTLADPYYGGATYNPTDWTVTNPLLTFTASSGAQDVYINYPGNSFGIQTLASFPDWTNDHTLFSSGLNLTTGEALLFGILGSSTPDLAAWYRPTWTGALTLIATTPWLAPRLTANAMLLYSQGHTHTFTDQNGTTMILLIPYLSNGYTGFCPSNGPISLNVGEDFPQPWQYPAPGDITYAWTQKYGALAPGQKISFAMKYLQPSSGEVSPTQTTATTVL